MKASQLAHRQTFCESLSHADLEWGGGLGGVLDPSPKNSNLKSYIEVTKISPWCVKNKNKPDFFNMKND